MFFLKKKIIFFFLGLLIFFSISLIVKAADCDDKSGTEKVTCLENKVSSLRGQANTLSSQISIMDSQISLTQARIEANERAILDLSLDIDTATKKITTLQDSLKKITERFMKRVVASYEAGSVGPMEILLSSSDISNLLTRLNYLKIVRAHDQRNIVDVQQATNDYTNQKDIYEAKKKKIETLKKQLEAYTSQLSQEKRGKKDLLTQTQGSESIYQDLLTKAREQLSALAGYADSVGTTLFPHQELSDSWGKYFNQRDSQWGDLLVNNDHSNCRGGPCTLARIGCLVTSYAMVVSHFGGSLLPSDVATNPSNFSAGTADFIKYGLSANGHSVTYVADPSMQQLRDALNSGKVVIAGMSINGGPSSTHYSDHWVVLRSVDGDSFRMNNPEYAGEMNVPLNDHYASWTIIEARIYN
jgi:peptidoglycan hydrolase CwlO-like protein